MIDVSVESSGILYNKMEFPRNIVNIYLTVSCTIKEKTFLSSDTSNRIGDDIGCDRFALLLVYVPDQKRGRCVYELRQSRVVTMCKKCNLRLYIGWNANFHCKLLDSTL